MQDKPAEPATRVRIDQAVGPPDGQVAASVYLTAAPNVKVGEIDLTVAIPTDLLSYQGVEASGVAEGVDAKVVAETKPGESNKADSILHLTISTIAEGASRQPLPDGALVHIMLKVAKDAKPDTTIPLPTKATVRTIDSPPKSVAPLTVGDGQVIVTEKSVTSCFFYMH